MRILIALVAGVVFSFGLTLSRMIDPARVLGFLDVAGAWNPSLLLVMVGALIVAAPAYALARKRRKPFCGAEFAIPARRAIDRPLLLGATLFGIGWGLSGYCPGPAVASLSFGLWQVWLFVIAMLIGMALQRALARS